MVVTFETASVVFFVGKSNTEVMQPEDPPWDTKALQRLRLRG